MKKIIFSILFALLIHGCAAVALGDMRAENASMKEFAKDYAQCLINNDYRCHLSAFGHDSYDLNSEQNAYFKHKLEKLSLSLNSAIKKHKGLKNIEIKVNNADYISHFYDVGIFYHFNDGQNTGLKSVIIALENNKWRFLEN